MCLAVKDFDVYDEDNQTLHDKSCVALFKRDFIWRDCKDKLPRTCQKSKTMSSKNITCPKKNCKKVNSSHMEQLSSCGDAAASGGVGGGFVPHGRCVHMWWRPPF